MEGDRAGRTASGLAGWRELAPLRIFARRGNYPWLVVGTVCIGAFMGQVDASIAQLVLPELEPEFHASVSAVAWVAVGYLLVVAASLPIFGRLADMFGRKLFYCGGFLVFVAGSALCGLAPSLDLLIAARVLQGLGAGLLQANSVAIVVAAAGPARRGRALGLQSAAQAVGLSAGPALGGFLIDALGWRWVFWINVPAGLAGSLAGLLILPRTERNHDPGGFDAWGAMLLAPALALLLLALNDGSHAGLSSPLLVGPAAAAALLLAGFVWHERRVKSPLLDLELFRKPVFVAGNLAGLLSYAVLFGAFFVLPFVLERAFGDTALAAGLRLTVIPAALGLVAPLSGAVYDRRGARLPTVAGMVIAFAALLVLSFSVGGGGALLPLMTAALGLLGIGQGLFTAPNNSSVMGSAASEESGQAGGLLNVMRALGMTLGISLGSVILAWRLPALPGQVPATLGIPAAALTHSAAEAFLAFAALALIAALFSLIRRRRAKPMAAGDN